MPSKTIHISVVQSLTQEIADIIEGRGESILDDTGVDEKVCREIAADVITMILKKAGQTPPIPKVIVEVSGGLMTDIWSDMPIQVKLKDWDNIKAGDAAVFLASVNDFSEPDGVLAAEEFQEKLIEDVQEYAEDQNESTTGDSHG